MFSSQQRGYPSSYPVPVQPLCLFVPEPAWGNLRDEELLKFSLLLCFSWPTGHCAQRCLQKWGKLLLKNKHKLTFTLCLYQFSGRKKKKPESLLGNGVKKHLEQLNIAETLSGICCLLSTVYQSLYLNLRPGLTGESTGALNEMDKWKLGEQTAVTELSFHLFWMYAAAHVLLYLFWGQCVDEKPGRRQWSWAERESVNKNKCTFK